VRRDSFPGVKRPLAITILAVIWWLEAAVLLLVGATLWLMQSLSEQAGGLGADLPPESAELLEMMAKLNELGALPVFLGVLLFFAALFVWFGIGLWKLKNWARRVTLVLSILRLLYLAPLLVIDLVRSDYTGAGLGLLMGVGYGLIVWYLFQPRIKQLFLPAPPPSAP